MDSIDSSAKKRSTLPWAEAEPLNWPLLSVAQSRDVDRVAMEEFGMAGIDLMRTAGAACAARLLEEFAGHRQSTIILAGTGNNGGDGYVIARHLHTAGCPVRVFSLGAIDKLHGDARQSYQDAVAANVDVAIADRVEEVSEIDFGDALIVDCLLGTGARGRPRSPFAEAIEIVNSLPQQTGAQLRRVAIDIPSGLDGDTGDASDVTFRADLTLTFVAPKTGMGHPAAARFTGAIEIVDIGIPEALERRLGIPARAFSQGALRDAGLCY